MLEIINAADMGLTGVVKDAQTGKPLAATVWVQELYWPCFTGPELGDYHRILLPGNYNVCFRANGYEEKTINVDVVDSDEPTVLDVFLNPVNDNYYAYQVTLCYYYDPYNYPNNFQNNPTEAISALGPPDGVCASLGKGGYIVLDMGKEGVIIDNENKTDFKIFEGGETEDGYHVYVSSNWSGPWVYMGHAVGTSEFDLANVSVKSAQFVKIVDDNDGNAYEQNPGVDIDAVQRLVYQSNPPNNPPSSPEINGPVNGKVGIQHTFEFVSIDPDEDNVYYFIFWGDGNNSGWLGPYNSSVNMCINYSWNKKGTYTINAKAKDVNGGESSWSELKIKISNPRNKALSDSLFIRIIKRFPFFIKLLTIR
jgi:hypothetical protein